MIAEIEVSALRPGPWWLGIDPEEACWQAEPEHQDYVQPHPGGYSCHFIRPSWRLPLAQEFQRSRTAEGPEPATSGNGESGARLVARLMASRRRRLRSSGAL